MIMLYHRIEPDPFSTSGGSLAETVQEYWIFKPLKSSLVPGSGQTRFPFSGDGTNFTFVFIFIKAFLHYSPLIRIFFHVFVEVFVLYFSLFVIEPFCCTQGLECPENLRTFFFSREYFSQHSQSS